MTEHLATELNSYFESKNLPLKINYFKSLWRLTFLEELPYTELIFVYMRLNGIHIWDGFPCFLTSAYTDEDITKVINTMIEGVERLIAVDIFQPKTIEPTSGAGKSSLELNKPPKPGAKLGLDEEGNPAWYVPSEKNEGTFEKIAL